MVRQILEYPGPAWTRCRVEDARALEKVQLNVARLVLRNEGASLSEAAVLERVGWPTLAWRRRLQTLCLFWQLVHSLGPP